LNDDQLEQYENIVLLSVEKTINVIVISKDKFSKKKSVAFKFFLGNLK